jgi:hypothetical protein
LEGFDSNKLLCDVSSVNSIINSNHALLQLEVSGHTPSTLAEQCLDLNHNMDKNKVIRDKILQFYFVGEFDVSLFSSMAVSVIPVIMSQIEGEDRQYALFRLLQWIPDLCNVSERTSSFQSSGNKRLKIDK